MARRDLSGALDVTVLERVACGDDAMTEEVLGLFVEQAALWAPLLDARSEGVGDALHTIRGTALGLGAGPLADACAEAEEASPEVLPAALDRVRDAMDATLTDIAAWRHELMLKGLRGR